MSEKDDTPDTPAPKKKAAGASKADKPKPEKKPGKAIRVEGIEVIDGPLTLTDAVGAVTLTAADLRELLAAK